MAENKRMEFAIGLFILTGMLITAGMVIVFGGGQGFVDSSYVVNIEFEHIGDLRKGAPVKLGGFRIGRVSDISLTEEGMILVEASISSMRKLRSDTKAQISNSGLVGDTFIEFSNGKSATYLATDDKAKVSGSGQVSTNEILVQVRDIGKGVLTLVDNLNEVVGDQKFKDDIRATVANVSKGTDEARLLVSDIRTQILSPENIARVQTLIVNVEDVTIAEKATTRHLNSILAQTDAIMKDEDQKLRATIENVAAITSDLKAKLAAIQPDKGIMRFFTTDEVNRQVDEIFKMVKGPMADLARLLSKSSKVDLWATYNMGARIATQREKEWKAAGAETSTEILEFEYKDEMERIKSRQTPPWKEIYDQMKDREEVDDLGGE